MTVPPPRDRMAAVRVCLQKSHTVGGRPFPRISAHDHRRHGMQVRGVGEEEDFSPAAVVLVHVLHTSHCIIEPLERCPVAKPHHSLDLPTAQDHCLAKSQSVSTLQPFFFLST